MLNNQLAITIANTSMSDNLQENHDQDDDDQSPIMRDIHALIPPRVTRGQPRETWEPSSRISSSLSMASSGDNFTTMSREFSALVIAGSTIGTEHESGMSNLDRIREHENPQEETNPLGPTRSRRDGYSGGLVLSDIISSNTSGGEVSVERVKKDEIGSKISAWQNAKIAKISNRFKRDDTIINGWEGEQVEKASSWMKKVERKLEEKRAKAMEKMQNDIAKAHRKAEERRATAEARRGTKVARILEIVCLMKAVGRPPVKRSFF